LADSTGAEPETSDENGEGITGKVKQAADAATKIPSTVKDAAAPVTESAASTVKKAAIRRRLRSKKVVIPAALTTATAAVVVAARKVSDGGSGGEKSGDDAGVSGFLARALSSVARLGDIGSGETPDDSGRESKESEGAAGADEQQEAQVPKSRRELDEGLRERQERRARRRESQAA